MPTGVFSFILLLGVHGFVQAALQLRFQPLTGFPLAPDLRQCPREISVFLKPSSWNSGGGVSVDFFVVDMPHVVTACSRNHLAAVGGILTTCRSGDWWCLKDDAKPNSKFTAVLCSLAAPCSQLVSVLGMSCVSEAKPCAICTARLGHVVFVHSHGAVLDHLSCLPLTRNQEPDILYLGYSQAAPWRRILD